MKTNLLRLSAALFFLSAFTASAAPIITANKDDNLAAGLRKFPGNTITYTTTIANTGDATATAVQFADPDPANTTFVSVNSTPLARPDSYSAIGNVQITIAAASGVLANDNDADDAVNGAGALSVSAGATSANGGNVSIAVNGGFTYNPAPGFTGADTFTYTLTDSEGSTDTGTVTINVTGLIWFINAAAGAGDGRLTSPFNSTAAYNASAPTKDPGDNIFLYTGTYSSGLTIALNQRLIGQGALTSLQAISGLTPPAGSLAFPATGGTRPTLALAGATGVILGGGNTINGLNITNSNGHGITGVGVGTLTLADFDVTVTNGFALTLTSSGTVTATGTDNDLSSTTGAALNVQNVTIGAAGMTFKSINSNGGVNNGITLDTTGSGFFTITGGGGVNSGGVITGKTGADASTTSGTGIFLRNVSGAVSLSRLDIESHQNYGIRGINVSGGLTLDNSSVGATSIIGNSTTTDAEAVTLVAGEGSVRFTNVTGTVNFTNDTFDNGFGRTIYMHTSAGTLTLNVTNSTLRESLHTGNGGSSTGGTTDAMFLQTINSATTNLTVTGSHFTAYRQFAILGDASGAATMNVDIGSCDFSNNNTGNANASAALNFGGSGGGGGGGNDAYIKYHVHDSTFRHGSGGVTPNNGGAQIVSGGVSGGMKVDGRIINNTFGVTGVPFTGAGNAADALRLFASGNNAASTRINGVNHTRYLVQGNTIQRYGEVGIQFNARQGNSRMDATVLGNIIREPGTAALGAFGAIWVNSGALPADTNTVNIAIGGTAAADKNTMQNSDPSNATDVFLDNNSDGGAPTILNLYRNGSGAGGAGEALLRQILVDDNNATLDLLGGFTNASTIGTVAGVPSQPSPLFFAPGEVEKKRAANVSGREGVPPSRTSAFQVRSRDFTPAIDRFNETPKAAGGTPTLPGNIRAVTQSELDATVAAARECWTASGLSGEQLATLDRLQFAVADLPGWYLGEADGERIRVDRDAGGNGWIVATAPPAVAATPPSQTVSAAPSPQDIRPRGEAPREQSAAGAPQPLRRVDLLTTLLHEMGHALGLQDTYAEADRENVMYGFLHAGERRFPTKGQAAGAVPHAEGAPHFLGTPLNIGDLPPGKTVTITYIVTINAGTTAIATSSQGTVSGSNIASKVTNDPQTGVADDATVTPIHQPPVVTNVGPLSVNEDAIFTFTAANFTGSYTDPNMDGLLIVRYLSLPANGVLKVAGTTMTSVPTDVAIGNIGTVTYTPNANFNGTDSFSWNASDGTLFAVSGATVNLTVNAVNDVPGFTKGADQTVLEDAAAQSVAGWATALSPGPANEAGQVLNFIVGNNNPGLFLVQPAIAANGTLTYTPAANANGSATVTVQIHDNGGVLNGGVDTSAAQSFLITVTGVNDVPGFVKGADQTVNEDAAAQSVAGWATALSAGPADEVGQAINFIVSNNNNPLFATQPAVAANGTLTYIPAVNANGSAIVTVQIHDSGGVLNGGVDTSGPQTFLINVTAVNDAPSFTRGANQTVNEDALAQTVPAWATALSAGPANEAGQVLNFIVGNNNPGLFAAQPAIAANGTLTFTPAANANGVATVSVQIHDNGGIANGGIDTSAPQSFTITVTAVNDPPQINAQVPIALAQGHARTIVFTDLTVVDPDNTYPTGFTLTVQNGVNYARVVNTITPTPGFVGTLSVPVQVNDSAANSNVFNLVVTVNPNAEQVATNTTIVPDVGSNVRLNFLGAPTAGYTIQFTNSLAPANWQSLATRVADANGRYFLVDAPPPGTPMRFYRSTEPYLNDFGNGLGPVTLRGSAVLTNSAMKLTDEVTGGSGAVVFEGLVPGPALNGFTARFNLAIGPISFGVPADGVSFAVGNLSIGTWGEAGPGAPNSLAVGFDTFDNGSAEGNIGIHVWVNGVHLALNATNPYTNGATVPVEIRYDTATGLTVRFNSVLIFTNLPIPGFAFPATDGRFGISARTGGFLERAVVDDVEITPR